MSDIIESVVCPLFRRTAFENVHLMTHQPTEVDGEPTRTWSIPHGRLEIEKGELPYDAATRLLRRVCGSLLVEECVIRNDLVTEPVEVEMPDGATHRFTVFIAELTETEPDEYKYIKPYGDDVRLVQWSPVNDPIDSETESAMLPPHLRFLYLTIDKKYRKVRPSWFAS